jgi:peptidoglycan/LPS O-acetylase OafA/YrhL
MKERGEFKVNNFDLLRLFAATEVVAGHYFEHLNITFSPLLTKILDLFPGVPIFFVISGYLISASYERNNDLVNYTRNRILRIFPALWCCIFLTIIIFSLTGVSFFNTQTIAWLPSQLAGITYTPKFLENYGFGSYNGSLWSIPVELQFYILLPICYHFISKNINILLFLLLAVFTVLHFEYRFNNFSHLTTKLLGYSFIPHFYLFLTGVIFQRLKLHNSRLIYNKALYWIILYVTFSLTLSDVLNPVVFSVIYDFLLAFCALSMAYTLPGAAKKILRSNDISYGVYIYHGLILTVLVQEKIATHVNLFELIIMTYIIAYLSWIFIEKPFINLKKKSLKPKLE